MVWLASAGLQRGDLGLADCLGDRCYLVIVEVERCGREVVFEVRACSGPRDRQGDG
jgi:hypothetical protein